MSTGENMAGWRPGASRHAVEARARLLQDIRAFLSDRTVLEVETPILASAGNSDPNLSCLSTDTLPRKYLRTSPEYTLKRMLAAGFGDIYELGRVFRAGEKGRFHNPEFTLLEWYRKDIPYLDLSSEVCELLRFCGRGQFDEWPVQHCSYRELFLQHTGIDPFFCTEDELAALAAERGLRAISLGLLEWLDLLLSHVIEPALPGETITVVYDFLPEQAALATVRADDPPVAERFEIYIGQVEIANGYQELSNPEEQLQRFESEQKLKTARGEETAPLDYRLIEALRQGLPQCSGVAMGVDRLLMSLLKLEHIDAVLAFSADRN